MSGQCLDPLPSLRNLTMSDLFETDGRDKNASRIIESSDAVLTDVTLLPGVNLEFGSGPLLSGDLITSRSPYPMHQPAQRIERTMKIIDLVLPEEGPAK
jgi:hypothetical protein